MVPEPEHPAATPTPSPVPYFSHIGKSGQDALWATYVIFVFITLFISVLTARLHAKHRALHLIALVITGVSALSYYAMSTHSGISYVSKGMKTINGETRLVLRQVFLARYINWMITVPLILLTLTILAGLPWMDVVLVLLSIEAAVFCTTFGSLLDHSREATKWAWYGHTCFFIFLSLGALLRKGRKCAKLQYAPVCRLYTVLAIYLVPLAIAFAIIFVLSEGKSIISVDAEVIAYAVFDLFSKAILPVCLVLMYRHDSEEMHIARLSDAWTEVRGRRGGIQLPEGD